MSEDDFENVTAGQFNRTEAQMGTDAYQANVAIARAQAELIAAQAETHKVSIGMMQDHHKRNSGLVGAAVIFLIPLYILALIYLIKVVF
jgi:hypothetical protein